MEKGICKLCDQSRLLAQSHVIPNFVYKWLKESSVTGYLRLGTQPSKRVQDGDKRYWLCGECEKLFNTWETEFANSIFHLANNREASQVEYRAWMLKFCVSISWRALLHMKEQDNFDRFSSVLQQKADNALHEWKMFLKGTKPNPGKNEQHFLPLGEIAELVGADVPTNINRYLLRAVEIDFVCSGDEKYSFVYSKLGRMIILGFLDVPFPQRWKGGKVRVHKGVAFQQNYSLPKPFLGYLFDRAKNMRRIESKISDKQKEKIENSYRANMDKMESSETISALEQDISLFGINAFNDPEK